MAHMPGNLPNFDRLDVLRCFKRIKHGISRAALTSELGLGEGTMRAVLDSLKRKGLIVSSRQGHSLTAKGEKLRSRLAALLETKEVSIRGFYPARTKHTFLLKLIRKIRLGYEQRDMAVRHGAEAALIMHYGTRLLMPDIEDFNTAPFEGLFSYRKNNVLLVTVAGDTAAAERSGLAVCESISPDIARIISRLC
jgi:hypothetical protein